MMTVGLRGIVLLIGEFIVAVVSADRCTLGVLAWFVGGPPNLHLK